MDKKALEEVYEAIVEAQILYEQVLKQQYDVTDIVWHTEALWKEENRRLVMQLEARYFLSEQSEKSARVSEDDSALPDM